MIRRDLVVGGCLVLLGCTALPALAANPSDTPHVAAKRPRLLGLVDWRFLKKQLRTLPRVRLSQLLYALRHPRQQPSLDGFISRVFNGDRTQYEQFVSELHAQLPSRTRVAVWGSSLSGRAWVSGKPFDSSGPGTSDLDIVLMGKQVMSLWQPGEFIVKGIASRTLEEERPEVAPALESLRQRLQEIAGGRPVSLQAQRSWYLKAVRILIGRPFIDLE